MLLRKVCAFFQAAFDDFIGLPVVYPKQVAIITGC
jgi:hypothetical protein